MAYDFLLKPVIGTSNLKMPKSTDRATMVWMMIVKVGLLIAAADAAFDLKKVWEFTKKNPELSEWPYNERTNVSFLLAYIALTVQLCLIIFSWNFISVPLLWKWHGPWAFVHGLVDLAIGVTLATAVGMQGVFLPGTVNGCKGSKSQTWQVVEGHKSYFVAIAEINGKNATAAEGICKDYVSTWGANVAIVFFQMFAAYIGIFFDGREQSLLNAWRPFVWLAIPLAIPFVCFTDFIAPQLRYSIHAIRKQIQGLRGSPTSLLNNAPTYHPKFDDINIQNLNLVRVLTIEHILLDIASYSHYDDIASLSLASRAVREAVFPAGDMEYRTSKLRTRCCMPASKEGCLYCNKPICNGCKTERYLPGLPGKRHLNKCIPYCATCYKRQYTSHQRKRQSRHPCRCLKQDHSHELQNMCQTCFTADVITLQSTRHEKYVQQTREMAFRQGAKCGSCKAMLGHGVRWWICGKCFSECRDRIHPQYLQRRTETDVEKGGEAGDGQQGRKWRWW